MEYTRHSSQPATVDLVRADLAEIWTVDEPEFESPKRQPSISGLSDMLDLEFIPTPGFRPSKTPRKDPLPDLLGDVLELSPTRKRGRDDGDRKGAPDNSLDSGNDEIDCGEQSRNRVWATADRLTQQRSRHFVEIIQSASRHTEEAETIYALRTASGQCKQTWPCQTKGRDGRNACKFSSLQVSSTTPVKPQTRRKAHRTQAPSEGTQAGQDLHSTQEESDKAR